MNAHIVNHSAAEKALFRQFGEQQRREPSPARAAAFARFADAGLPTRRIESWHYTDLRAAMADAAPLAAAPTPAEIEAARAWLTSRERFVPGARLVLIGGRFIGELSDRLPPGVTVSEGAIAGDRVDDPLAALNEALSPSGCTITVASGADIAEPITLLHLTNGTSAHSVYSRCAIALDAGAGASFVEVFDGARAGVQRHAATVISLAKGASAIHVAVVGDEPGLHIETQTCDLAAGAEFAAFGLVAGGDLTRRQIFVRMNGEEAKARLGGLALIEGDRRADTTLQVVHAAPRGMSREFYRAIVDDDAVGVFQGKIIVERAAQKTDGAMKSQAILLSPRAQMNEKPEARDLRRRRRLRTWRDGRGAGPGAGVLFGLARHRGARREGDAARGVRGESIDRIENAVLIEALRARLRAWLGSRT